MFHNIKKRYRKIQEEYNSGNVEPLFDIDWQMVESVIAQFNYVQLKVADYSVLFSAFAALSIAAMATVSAPTWVTVFHLSVGALLLTAYIRRTK